MRQVFQQKKSNLLIGGISTGSSGINIMFGRVSVIGWQKPYQYKKLFFGVRE